MNFSLTCSYPESISFHSLALIYAPFSRCADPTDVLPRKPTSVIFQAFLAARVSIKLFSGQRAGDNSLKNGVIPWALAAMKMESLYQIIFLALTTLFRAVVMRPMALINVFPSTRPSAGLQANSQNKVRHRSINQTMQA